MATNSTTPAPAFNWSDIIPLLEVGTNVTLAALGTTGVVPGGPMAATLAQALEAAVNPLIAQLQNKGTTSQDVMAGFGTLIGVITALQKQAGLPVDVMNKLDSYAIAAQDGAAGYLTSQTGFNPAQYAPLEPLTPVQ